MEPDVQWWPLIVILSPCLFGFFVLFAFWIFDKMIENIKEFDKWYQNKDEAKNLKRKISNYPPDDDELVEFEFKD